MTKKEAKLKKENNQLPEVSFEVDSVIDNNTILLSGGWKLTGTNVGDAVQRYIDEEKKI